MEPNLIALSAAYKEVKWLKNCLMEIPVSNKLTLSVTIYCDSQATLACTTSNTYNRKSRHISLRHNYVKEIFKDGITGVT